jgi:hypothetical protein
MSQCPAENSDSRPKQRLNTTLPGLVINSLVLLAAIALLLHFWWPPDHREYLWLGLYLLS